MAEPPDIFTGALFVKSSIQTWSIDSSQLMSLTIGENKKGPITVPYGTPLLISRKSVSFPAINTHCLRFVKKSIIQLII